MIFAKYQNQSSLITLQEIITNLNSSYSKNKFTYYLIATTYHRKTSHQIEQKYHQLRKAFSAFETLKTQAQKGPKEH